MAHKPVGRDGFCCDAHKMALTRAYKKHAARKEGKHGDTRGNDRLRLYKIWAGMKNRCSRKSQCVPYKYYGSRGISVCPEWRTSYQAFRSWALANGYQENLVIDRKDNNGNYEPSNCQWITRSEHSRKSNADRKKTNVKDG
jgi:hypothetical protein